MRAWVAATVVLAGLSMASWTSAVESGEAGLLPWLAQPDRYAGAHIVVPLAEVTQVEPHGYRARKAGQVLTIESSDRGVAVGETYTLGGTFQPERGVVVESWRELHRYRPHKKALGVLGTVLSTLLLLSAVRRRGRGLELRDA